MISAQLPAITYQETAHLGPLDGAAAVEILFRSALHPTLRMPHYPNPDPGVYFELARLWGAISEATLALPMMELPRGTAAPHFYRTASQGAQHLANLFWAETPRVEAGEDPLVAPVISPDRARDYRSSTPSLAGALLLGLARYILQENSEVNRLLFNVISPAELVAQLGNSTATVLRHHQGVDLGFSIFREAGRHFVLWAALAATPLRSERTHPPT